MPEKQTKKYLCYQQFHRFTTAELIEAKDSIEAIKKYAKLIGRKPNELELIFAEEWDN